MIRAQELVVPHYKETVEFYTLIKKIRIDIGIKKKKWSRHGEDILKDNCQTFGIIIVKT